MSENKKAEPRMENFEKEVALAEERMKKLKEDLENVDPQVVAKAKKILQANAEASGKSAGELDLDLSWEDSETPSKNEEEESQR